MKKITLAQQLYETARAVQSVHQGKSLDQVLQEVDPVLRPGVQALSFHVLRHLALGQTLLTALARKMPPVQVRALLWVTLTLSATQDEKEDSLPVHAAQKSVGANPFYQPYVLVSQAVDAAKMHTKTRAFAPLINGILRNFLRDKEHLLKAAKNGDFACWNFQPWWIEQVRQDWPMHWQSILMQAQQPAPMTLRVNAQWAHVEQARDYLVKNGLFCIIVGEHALELQTPVPVEQIPGFEQGWFSVQAYAAQLAAPLLLEPAWVRERVKILGRPLRVLDACAAPGGKTAHMMEQAEPDSIEIVAIDADANRVEKLQQTIERVRGGLQLYSPKIDVRVGDAGDSDAFAHNEMFDAILLDAPCTASGIVRRHPDIRWLRQSKDIMDLAKQQHRLLDILWKKLQVGGRLLYCTCSVFKAEGQHNINRFIEQNERVKTLPAYGHLLPIEIHSKENGFRLPTIISSQNEPLGATDGFYYALFEK